MKQEKIDKIKRLSRKQNDFFSASEIALMEKKGLSPGDPIIICDKHPEKENILLSSIAEKMNVNIIHLKKGF